MRAAEMGEKKLLEMLTKHWKAPHQGIGVGDDCALVPGTKTGESFVLKTDAVVEGVHFLPDAQPEWIGRKALARAVSDFAAMGATPRYALITVGLPPETAQAKIKKIYRGIEKIAATYGVALVGGETTKARELFLSVALMGTGKKGSMVLRSTAKAGDEIWVTGKLGATQQRKHFLFLPRLAEGQWLARQKMASAMMDLSDGLGADLPRLAEASHLGFIIQPERIPCHPQATLNQALRDGEDYELLFTVSHQKSARLRKAWPFALPITCIGKMVANRRQGLQKGWHGYDHFG